MKKALVACSLLVVAVGLLLSCGPQPGTEAPVQVSESAAPEPTMAPVALGELVEVTADGTAFEPAVTIDRIPEGVWYCDMGTVHYARAEEGDGRCAECGMKLVQKTPADVDVPGHDSDEGAAPATLEG